MPLAQAFHDRMTIVLLYGARGDLRLTGFESASGKKGDYGCLVHEGAPDQVLARIGRKGWHLTPSGANFLLENLSGCYSDRDRIKLEGMLS